MREKLTDVAQRFFYETLVDNGPMTSLALTSRYNDDDSTPYSLKKGQGASAIRILHAKG